MKRLWVLLGVLVGFYVVRRAWRGGKPIAEPAPPENFVPAGVDAKVPASMAEAGGEPIRSISADHAVSSPERPGIPPATLAPPQYTAPATDRPASKSSVQLADLPTARRSIRVIEAGVDFGTSTTKVIWHDSREQMFEVFRWNRQRGVNSALLNSTISVVGDELHFGQEPGELPKDSIRSIKLCMLCARNNAICRCQSAVAKNGLVNLPGTAAQRPADLMAALFLAWVFQRVEKHLLERFASDDLTIIWNVGCPMDHLDSANSKAAWESMVGTAMELRQTISNPAPASSLEAAARISSQLIVPPESDRSYAVQPEGLAAVKAFLDSPHAEDSKSYAIVDVGAGTTEVSFFFNGRIMAEGGVTRPSYLADSTEAVGGGKIDVELSQQWNCTAEEARIIKEARSTPFPVLNTIAEISSQYHSTCVQIIRAARLTSPADKHLDLFVIGGGSRLSPLREALENKQLPGGFTRDRTRTLEPPRNLRDRSEFFADYDLLANACGLARAIGWEYYPPRAVAAMAGARTGTRLDRDELYPH